MYKRVAPDGDEIDGKIILRRETYVEKLKEYQSLMYNFIHTFIECCIKKYNIY